MNKKNKSFFRLFFKLFFIFLVVVTLLKIVVAIFKGGINGMVAQYFSKETFYQFAKIQLILSALYGLFMAGYYKFIRKE